MPGRGRAGRLTMAFYVYMARCADGTLYTGYTTDLSRREQAHNAGKGAKYTRSRRPVRLVWAEQCPDKSAALRREWAVKRLTRREKLALIAAGGADGDFVIQQ